MGRAPCCDKNGLKKGPWTPEEDQKLVNYIQKNGYGNWRILPKNAGLGRCGKSCRLRWTNYLRPDIRRGRFSFEEEETIIQLHSVLGNKWSAIAARLPGRTDNEIKNYWNTHIRKRLLRMGIDPVTHSPRLDLLDLSSILNSSFYNNSSQMNISRLLGVQPLQVNPELLRLATSLLPSHRENPNFFQQNVQENQLNCHQVPNDQLPPLIQPSQVDQEFPNCVPFCNEAQIGEPQFTQFNSQNCQLNDWQCNEMPTNMNDNHVSVQDFGYYGSNQYFMDHLASDNSAFQSNSSDNNNNFSFTSVLSNLSTAASSPTCINTTATTEDDRESYSSNMLKFEIPDLWNVNGFM